MNNFGETVTSVSVTSDSMLFAAGGTNKRTVVYDAGSGEIVAEFIAEFGINAIVCAGEGSDARVISGSFGGWVRVYSIALGAEECVARMSDGEAVHCMAFAEKASRLAVGGTGSHISLFDVHLPEVKKGSTVDHARLQALMTFETAGGLTVSVSLDADGCLLAAGGEARVVQLWTVPWHLTTSAKKYPVKGAAPTVQFRTSSTVHALALAASGHLAVGTNETVEVYLVERGADGSIVGVVTFLTSPTLTQHSPSRLILTLTLTQ